MGKGRRKLKKIRATKAKCRRNIKRKMGKPIYLTLIRYPGVHADTTDQYVYKATIFQTSYKHAELRNVRWQASSLTHCCFRGAHLTGVDFLNSNLKNTSFNGATLEDVVFFNCNLKNVDFTGAKFRRVAFISLNTKVAKNLKIDDECYVYSTYPSLKLDPHIEAGLLELCDFIQFYKYGVLFVNRNKLNKWIIQFLVDIYGDRALKALCAVKNRKNKNEFYTVYSYMQHIEKYLKI